MDQIKLKCLVVDDEPLAVEKLAGFISRLDFLELADTANSATEALNILKSKTIDLLFLDIQMDDLTGIQLLGILTVKPQVILTTAYAEYALKGYELDVTDYLLKPIAFERFLQAANKAIDKAIPPRQEAITHRQPSESPTRSASREFIMVKADYHMEKINIPAILFIEGMKDYLGIMTAEKRVMTLMNFATMESMLPPSGFFRVHKSFIVALAHIDKIDRNHLVIQKHRIPIGETYRKAFFSHLKDEGIIQ